MFKCDGTVKGTYYSRVIKPKLHGEKPQLDESNTCKCNHYIRHSNAIDVRPRRSRLGILDVLKALIKAVIIVGLFIFAFSTIISFVVSWCVIINS